MEENSERGKWLSRLAGKKLAVFGTGFVAEMFWYALERHGLTEQVLCFAESEPGKPPRRFHGLPILGAEALGQLPEVLICLAVHAALAGELEGRLSALAPGRVVWIYPGLYELLYGVPVRRGVRIPRLELLRSQDADCHWISVRYLAARDYLRRSAEYAESREIYLRAMSAHCSPATAAQRLRGLEALADAAAERGLDECGPLLIDTRYRIIDGLHRLAVACVLEIPALSCDVAAASDIYDVLLGDKNRLPERVLPSLALTPAQRERLRRAKEELKESVA